MQIDYDEDKDKWRVYTELRDTERMTTITNARALRKYKGADPTELAWGVPATLGAAKQLRSTCPEARWSSDARDRRATLLSMRVARISAITGDTPFQDDRLSPKQRDGVSFLLQGSGLLADDQGSGKTVQTCVALEESGASETLILTTKSTLYVWAEHIEEWTTATPFVFHGTKSKQDKAYKAYMEHEGSKVLIATHAAARSHSSKDSFGNVAAEGEPGRFNQDWDLCVVDESIKIGVDPKAPGVRAVWQIGKTSKMRWALTGTPINDVPDDLWLLFRFVEPDLFGRSRGPFRDRYCIMKDEFFGGRTNKGIHPDRDEELQWLLRPYFLRRLKREVVEGLPDAMPIQYVTLPLTTKQGKAYGQMVKSMMANTDTGLLVSPDQLSKNQSFEYIADGTPVLDDDGTVASLEPSRTSSNKLDYIMDIAEQRKGDPFVVYAYSSKTVEMIRSVMDKAGYRVAALVGSTSLDLRKGHIKQFQAGNLDVILLTDAGAEGITLTAADLIIFARESWRAITNQQVKDRIDRWGQTRPPHTIVLLSEGTVDVTRRLSLEGKVDMQQQILKDKDAKAFLTGGV